MSSRAKKRPLIKRIVVKHIPPVRSVFYRFFALEAAGGILLLFFTLFSIAIANIPALSCVAAFFAQDFTVGFTDGFNITMSLTHWINDGLMVLFFFVVGMEIKRELLVGELSSFKQASLPVMAALGGMLVPAFIYAIFNGTSTGQEFNGWGIPMATDIAFAIGILSLLGKRVPLSLKIFLTALAIVDDLGAIVVIAIFYPVHALHYDMLLLAGGVMLLVYLLSRLHIRYTLIYIATGITLWLLILESGLHATIAGVLLAILVPIGSRSNQLRFSLRCKKLINELRNMQVNGEDKTMLTDDHQKMLTLNMHREVYDALPPLLRYEYTLHPWVMYVVMPLFALVNAGVYINADIISGVTANASLGVFMGLVLGKPIGIVLFTYIAVKSKLADFPKGCNWAQLLGIGLMAGIGFTMSVFIANLAFTDVSLVASAKFAILIASTTAGIFGAVVLSMAGRRNAEIH